MTDIIKTCKNHGDLTVDKLIMQGSRNGSVSYRCRQCMSESHKKHYMKNREKVRQAHIRYREENPERYRQIRNASKRKMYALNPEKDAERKRIYARLNPGIENDRKNRHKKKAVRELDDFYVKYTIVRGTSLRNSDIPEAMVKLKKALMLLRRQSRKMRIEQNVENKEP